MTKTNLFHDSNNSDNIQMGLPSKSTTIIAFIYFVFKMATISHHNDFHNGYQYTKLIVNTKGFFYVHNIFPLLNNLIIEMFSFFIAVPMVPDDLLIEYIHYFQLLFGLHVQNHHYQEILLEFLQVSIAHAVDLETLP